MLTNAMPPFRSFKIHVTTLDSSPALLIAVQYQWTSIANRRILFPEPGFWSRGKHPPGYLLSRGLCLHAIQDTTTLQNEAGNIERSDPCLRATYSPAFILYTRLTSYPTTPFSASLSSSFVPDCAASPRMETITWRMAHRLCRERIRSESSCSKAQLCGRAKRHHQRRMLCEARAQGQDAS